MNAAQLLETARTAGLSLSVEGTNLAVDYEVDPPHELIARLREHRGELIAVLSDSGRIWPAAVGGIFGGAHNVPTHDATGSDEPIVGHREMDPAWWHSRYRERAAHWAVGGRRPRAVAEMVAWGEVQWLWYKLHGERTPPGRCAGCQRSIGSEKALDLICGSRVHYRPHHSCLIRYGEHWRAAADRALAAMGLHPPGRRDNGCDIGLGTEPASMKRGTQ